MGNGFRYGLLAAVTAALAGLLLWDRLHPPGPGRLHPRAAAPADTARILVGGPELPPPPPRPLPAPAAPPARPGEAPLPGEPAASAAPPASPDPGTYVIAGGDTLGTIAQRTLGSARRAGEIARANGMTLDASLRVGKVLRIPAAAPAADGPVPATPPRAPERTAAAPPAARPAPATVPTPASTTSAGGTHRVAKGDTLYALGRRYYGTGAAWKRIAEANGIDAGAPLSPGTELRLP
jgi:nucleoid-associated protein YgaU